MQPRYSKALNRTKPHRHLLIILFCSLFLFSNAALGAEATEPIEIGSTLQLFVDDHLIARQSGTSYRLHSPMRREVVYIFDQPWEGGQSAYVTVLDSGSEYRMYYRGGGDLSQEVTYVAMSKDGIHWERPVLGLYEFEGSKENNIIWRGRKPSYWESHNFAPFLDENPAALPNQKYKAVALGRYEDEAGETRRMLVGLVSPDCIHWERLREDPIIRAGSFDSQNTALWDPNLQKYVCFSSAGRNGKRQIQRSTSVDFVEWSEPKWIEYDPPILEQFYTNGIVRYPRSDEYYIGLPMRFVP